MIVTAVKLTYLNGYECKDIFILRLLHWKKILISKKYLFARIQTNYFFGSLNENLFKNAISYFFESTISYF